MSTDTVQRLRWITVALLCAMLVAIVVGTFAIVGTLQAQADQRTYENCMARHGFDVSEPATGVTTADELDAWSQAIVEAATACGR